MEERGPHILIGMSYSYTHRLQTKGQPLCLSTDAIPCLFLSRQIEGRLFQGSSSVMHLDDIAIGGQDTISSQIDIFFALVLGESPLERFENFLAAGKLEFASSNGFNDVGFKLILGPDTQQDLSNVDTGGDTNGFAVRMAHSTRQAIGAGTRQHFVGPQHMKGMGADANVVIVFANILGQMLVNGNSTGFQGFGGNLLLFVTDQMSDKGKQIDRGFLGARIKNTNLGFGDTATIPTLNVRLVLLVPVTTSGTTTHDGKV